MIGLNSKLYRFIFVDVEKVILQNQYAISPLLNIFSSNIAPRSSASNCVENAHTSGILGVFRMIGPILVLLACSSIQYSRFPDDYWIE